MPEDGSLQGCSNDDDCVFMNNPDAICADMYFEISPLSNTNGDGDDEEDEEEKEEEEALVTAQTKGVANVCTLKYYCDKAFTEEIAGSDTLMYT